MLDECKSFTFYQKDLKMLGNSFQKKLDNFIKDKFGEILEVAPNATSNLYANITDLIIRMSKQEPETLAMINKLLEARENNQPLFNSICASHKIKAVEFD